jgi:hypothetical protein
MKRNRLFAVATTGLITLTALSGAAFAANDNESVDASELQQFLKENPAMHDLIAPVEASTGGKVIGMEIDDEASGQGTLVEVDVKMADGSAKEFMVNADTKMIKAQGDDHAALDDGDGDGETNDDADAGQSN